MAKWNEADKAVLVVSLVFIAVLGLAIYFILVKPSMERRRQSKAGAVRRVIDVKLFSADWCGNCQTFKPEWDKLQQLTKRNPIGNLEIHTHVVDCTQDSSLGKALSNHYVAFDDPRNARSTLQPVMGFPTVTAQERGIPGSFACEIRPRNLEGADELISNIQKIFF